MRTEPISLKLSQEAGSISSTDTSEIGFGLPLCVYTGIQVDLSLYWSARRKGKAVKDRKGDEL